MEPHLAQVVQIAWSESLRLTRAAGDCEGVLRTPAGELVGRGLHEVLGIPEPEAAALDRKARSGGGPEFVRAQPAGQVHWLRLQLGAWEGQAAAGILDVEAALQGAPPLQIFRLSSSLSHELRNPLSSVKMAVQTLARNTSLSDRDQRRLVIANREVRTMERMLWMLSEYGRDTPPNREAVALRALVQEAAAMIEPELSERRIPLQIDSPDDGVLPRVRVDPGRLRPVLAQLLLNVAMGQVEGTPVAIRLERGDGCTRLLLWDPAASLPAEEQAQLFEPFGSMLARGAGLSLATLRAVMRWHGGSVSAESSPSGGTVYTLSFPDA